MHFFGFSKDSPFVANPPASIRSSKKEAYRSSYRSVKTIRFHQQVFPRPRGWWIPAGQSGTAAAWRSPLRNNGAQLTRRRSYEDSTDYINLYVAVQQGALIFSRPRRWRRRNILQSPPRTELNPRFSREKFSFWFPLPPQPSRRPPAWPIACQTEPRRLGP